MTEWLWSFFRRLTLKQAELLICKEFNHADLFVQGAIRAKNILITHNVQSARDTIATVAKEQNKRITSDQSDTPTLYSRAMLSQESAG